MDRRKELKKAYLEREVIGGVFAVRNTANGKRLLLPSTDLQSNKNQFAFCRSTNCCFKFQLQEDWNAFGADAFVFEVLEELEKKNTQSQQEFKEDVQTLEALWREKFSAETLY